MYVLPLCIRKTRIIKGNKIFLFYTKMTWNIADEREVKEVFVWITLVNIQEFICFVFLIKEANSIEAFYVFFSCLFFVST